MKALDPSKAWMRVSKSATLPPDAATALYGLANGSGKARAARDGSLRTPGTPRKPGKRPGAKGIWRCEALTAERAENHYPDRCAACGAPLELWHGDKGHSGHFVLDLERLPGGVRIACVLHRLPIRDVR